MRGGFGGMLSILVKGNAQQAQDVCSALELVLIGASLGGIESVVEHRASVEGPDSVVPKNLVRFSIGIEPVEELIADLVQALAVLDRKSTRLNYSHYCASRM